MIKWFVEKIYHYSTALTSWSWTWLYGKRKIIVPKKINEDDCVCEELGEADGRAYKIKYVNILTVDGQEPNELAAVYGLGPKTARFKKRKSL